MLNAMMDLSVPTINVCLAYHVSVQRTARNLVCQNGRCEATAPCTQDSDCEEGSICNTGRGSCVLGCRFDSQCPQGTTCENFKCVFAPECVRDGDCAANQQCVDGVCQDSGCRTDNECADGQICQNNNCVSGCRNNQDCLANQVCVSNRCQAVAPECRADTDCAVGQICNNGQCAAGCRTDAQCPDGFTCENNQCEVENECQDAPNPQLIPSTGGTFDASAGNAESNYVGSCGGAGPERVFVLEVVEGRLFRIRTESQQEQTDTVLYLRAECDVSFTERACNDDADANFNSLLEISLDPGRYFLFVDNFATAGRIHVDGVVA